MQQLLGYCEGMRMGDKASMSALERIQEDFGAAGSQIGMTTTGSDVERIENASNTLLGLLDVGIDRLRNGSDPQSLLTLEYAVQFTSLQLRRLCCYGAAAMFRGAPQESSGGLFLRIKSLLGQMLTRNIQCCQVFSELGREDRFGLVTTRQIALAAAYVHILQCSGTVLTEEFLGWCHSVSPRLACTLIYSVLTALQDKKGFVFSYIGRTRMISALRDQGGAVLVQCLDRIYSTATTPQQQVALLPYLVQCLAETVAAAATSVIITEEPYTKAVPLWLALSQSSVVSSAMTLNAGDNLRLASAMSELLSGLPILSNEVNETTVDLLSKMIQYCQHLLSVGYQGKGRCFEQGCTILSEVVDQFLLSMTTVDAASGLCQQTIQLLTALGDFIPNAPASAIGAALESLILAARAVTEAAPPPTADEDDDEDDLEWLESLKAVAQLKVVARSRLRSIFERLAFVLWEHTDRCWTSEVVNKMFSSTLVPQGSVMIGIDGYTPGIGCYERCCDDSQHCFTTRFDDDPYGYGLFVALRDLLTVIGQTDEQGAFVNSIVGSVLQNAGVLGQSAGAWLKLTALLTPRWGSGLVGLCASDIDASSMIGGCHPMVDASALKQLVVSGVSAAAVASPPDVGYAALYFLEALDTKSHLANTVKAAAEEAIALAGQTLGQGSADAALHQMPFVRYLLKLLFIVEPDGPPSYDGWSMQVATPVSTARSNIVDAILRAAQSVSSANLLPLFPPCRSPYYSITELMSRLDPVEAKSNMLVNMGGAEDGSGNNHLRLALLVALYLASAPTGESAAAMAQRTMSNLANGIPVLLNIGRPIEIEVAAELARVIGHNVSHCLENEETLSDITMTGPLQHISMEAIKFAVTNSPLLFCRLAVPWIAVAPPGLPIVPHIAELLIPVWSRLLVAPNQTVSVVESNQMWLSFDCCSTLFAEMEPHRLSPSPQLVESLCRCTEAMVVVMDWIGSPSYPIERTVSSAFKACAAALSCSVLNNELAMAVANYVNEKAVVPLFRLLPSRVPATSGRSEEAEDDEDEDDSGESDGTDNAGNKERSTLELITCGVGAYFLALRRREAALGDGVLSSSFLHALPQRPNTANRSIARLTVATSVVDAEDGIRQYFLP